MFDLCKVIALIEEISRDSASSVSVDVYVDGQLVSPSTTKLNFTGCRFEAESGGDGCVDVSIRPFVLGRKAGIGFTRKGGFIMSRKGA